MSKFCHKCGSKLSNEDVFCQICGEKQVMVTDQSFFSEETPVEESAAEPVAELQPSKQEVPQEPDEKKKKTIPIWAIITAAALATVLVFTFLVSALIGAPYKRTVQKYFDVYFRGEIELIEDLAPEEFWDYYGMGAEELIAYYDEYGYYDQLYSAFEAEYGNNIKVSYKIVFEDELSKRKLDIIKDGLKELYGIPRRTVKKAYELELEVTIEGSKDSETEETELIVVNIDNNWYVVSDRGEISFYWGNDY